MSERARELKELEGMSEQELLKLIDKQRLPGHIAVIMDGNRRWARRRHLPAIFGHKAGFTAFRTVMETCHDLGVKVLTAYAFSAENWQRAPAEVELLMQLFEFHVKSERKTMMRNGVRFRCLGDVDTLPETVRKAFRETEELTAANEVMSLNLAVNYGGRAELVRAARRLAQEVQQGSLEPAAIDEAAVARELYTSGQPDPDLLIRTSGELRVSNFLLWQMAYTEFWFGDILWPDVNAATLYRAILAYQHRERRRGA